MPLTARPPSHRRASVDESPSWRVSTLTRLTELHALAPEWEAMAGRALEPNVFYEPWMMLPALELYHRQQRLEVYTVHAVSAAGSRLALLLPFEVQPPSFAHPLPRRRLLRYFFCGLCTPLLDRELGAAALTALMPVLERRGGLFEFQYVHADGPVMAALRSMSLGPHGLPPVTRLERALLRPRGSAEDYLASLRSRRAELRRCERRLGEQGRLEYDALPLNVPAEPWIDEFLALEASGWKGREKTAFASSPEGTEYFRRICLAAHERGRLEIHALRLDDRPLALLCLLRAGDGYYAFRTAYDEAYSRYAPGVLLAVQHSCRMHQRPDVAWVDSCADPRSRLDNDIWADRLGLGEMRLSMGATSRLLRSLDKLRELF